MKLKSLELEGFKSFPDRTRLNFTNGFTAVVGPNGSGKSNISDAIRWVLGEQSSKTLRGLKMEDVIFLGTKSRKSHGVARVALTFDNSDRTLDVDEDEVVVARRYDRSGESEYLINGKSVLLKEVSELLMDTGLSKEGYSIIGQGRIDEIVSAKSSDRRQIFEEAAGITKYRYRKTSAEKQLLLAQENLLRLTDILTELESRVEPLRLQAKKARKFRALDEQKEQLELSLWMLDLEDEAQELRRFEDEWYLLKGQYEQEEKHLSGLADKAQAAYDQMEQCRLQMERLREGKGELARKASEREKSIAVWQGDIAHAKETAKRIEEDKQALSLSGDSLMQQCRQYEEQANQIREQIKEQDEQVKRTQQALLHFNDQKSGVTENCDELTQRLNQLALERSKDTMNISAFTTRLGELEEQARERQSRRQEIEREYLASSDELKQTEKLLCEIANKQESLSNARAGYEMKSKSRKEKLSALDQKLSGINKTVSETHQRLHILEELQRNLEGFSHSVKQVLSASKRGELTGVFGMTAELLQVPEQYTVAIETALGAALQNIVVKDETAAKAAIRFLKEHRAGRATFLPLTSIHGNRLQKTGWEHEDGVVGIASDLISSSPAYRNIFENLLGRTVVVSDLDDGVELAKKFQYRFRIVTLDGQQIHAGGSLTGGSKSKNVGLLSRKNEIDRLLEKQKQYAASQEKLQQERAEMQEKLQKLSAQIQALSGELLSCHEDEIRFQAEKKRLTELTDRLHSSLTLSDQAVAQIQKQTLSLQETLEKTKDALAQSEQNIQKAEQELTALQSEQEGIRAKRHELEEEIHQSDVARTKLFEELKHSETMCEDLRQRLAGNQDKLSELSSEQESQHELIKQREQEIDEAFKNQGEDEKKAEELSEQIQTLLERRTQAEQSASLARKEERDHQEDKERLAGKIARLEEKKLAKERDRDAIISKMWESYQTTVSEARERMTTFDDPGEAKRKLAHIKGEIRALGSVNLGAIEEYDEVSTRYAFLSGQVKDAKHSKEELEKMIEGLTSSMQNLFIKAFDEINRQFQRIFVQLFGGGRASLSLEDPENVLDCGIQIQVEPPGKIIKNISALSGGEKAFVAIAIYFAIIRVRPAPFCVLDEIEAALDDVNVDKFAAYLKHLDDDTQFIVITHRRGTMEQADMLYGVTMQEEGVSKLLQLKVSEAAAMAAS